MAYTALTSVVHSVERNYNSNDATAHLMPSFSRLPFNYVSVGGVSKPFKDVGGADFDAMSEKETAAYEAVKQRIHKPGTLKSHGRHAEMSPPPHAWSMTEHDQTRELERRGGAAEPRRR